MSASRGLRVSALYDDDDIAMRLGIEEAVYGSSLWPGCHSASSLNGFMYLYLYSLNFCLSQTYIQTPRWLLHQE